jgi:SAM-dependent methyltransferase
MLSERIHLSRDATDVLEHELSLRRHVERYLMARQFLLRRVLGASCGVGYGSYLRQKNPDVTGIVGIDMDPAAIEWARAHFHTAKARLPVPAPGGFRRAGFRLPAEPGDDRASRRSAQPRRTRRADRYERGDRLVPAEEDHPLQSLP